MSSGEDTNNRGNLPEPTWEDERLSVTSFTKLSPGLVNQFLSSLGYLCGVRVDSDAGPQCTPYQVALTREGKSPYIQEVTDINTELIDTCNRREANYEHCGWSSEALLTLSPWTQLRISNGSKPEFSQPESSVTKRVAVYRLRIEVSQHDLLPTPEFRAAIQDALGRETRSERFQATYRVFEHWGDVIPLVFDVGTSLAITDLKHNYEANAIDLTGLQLYRAIEHHTARVSTRGVNLGVLRSGFGAWLYSPEIPIGHWSQVRVTKAAPITTLLSEEHQTQISDLHSSMISYSPLVFRGETFGDSTCALHSIKSVTIWTNDHVVSLRVAHWSENAEVEGNEERGPGSTFTLETGDYVTQVMTWKDSQGICALQFFTRNGLVSECYGGGGGTPTIMDGAEGCLIGLRVRMKAQIVHEIEGDWCKDTRDEKSGVQWGFSQYYGNEEGTRFDDWTLIGGSTSTFVTSVKVRAGSYSYVDGIQLAYSRPESGSAAALQGSYHGGSGSKEDTLDLDSGEYIISIGGKIEGRIRQLSFTTNLGRKWTVSAKKDSGKQFVCIAPQGVGGRSMRLYSIIGRCDSSQSMNGVLFVWVSV